MGMCSQLVYNRTSPRTKTSHLHLCGLRALYPKHVCLLIPMCKCFPIDLKFAWHSNTTYPKHLPLEFLVGDVSQAISKYVPWEEHETYPLNAMAGYNEMDEKFVCHVINGNHHGTKQSVMHQIWEFVWSHNRPSQSKWTS